MNKIFVRDYMPSESIPMTLTRETKWKLHIVSNCCKIWFSSIIEGDLIYFFKYFFLAADHRGRICLYSGVLNWRGSFIFLRWWNTFCFNVLESLCVRLIFQLCIVFATLDLSEKKKKKHLIRTSVWSRYSHMGIGEWYEWTYP